MMIKIGDVYYDSKRQPIMVIFAKEEKEAIKSTDEESTMFCAYPETMTETEAKVFMGLD